MDGFDIITYDYLEELKMDDVFDNDIIELIFDAATSPEDDNGAEKTSNTHIVMTTWINEFWLVSIYYLARIKEWQTGETPCRRYRVGIPKINYHATIFAVLQSSLLLAPYCWRIFAVGSILFSTIV
ncbi:hypothetical protein CEXT_274691 [Caerostris extrusa]|uniref:Uncharacterized protein n=1 Tax=Caerostris extrusa TaxID=172846 RepID=A0AAV4RCR3_CAEEX|nr:hypothetical protein CEXT_274691 [Caerostris extrusa]